MVCFTLLLVFITALFGTSRALYDDDDTGFGFKVPTCKGWDCDSTHVCVVQNTGPTCAVKNGLPCKFNDVCQGGYYCPSSKTCAGGPDGIAEGSPCVDIGCKPGLYCDRSQKKCLQITGGSFCTGDYECKSKCDSPTGCYCDNGKCLPNP